LRTFVGFTTEAAIWVKEKSTKKEGGLARTNAIENDWSEDWFT